MLEQIIKTLPKIFNSLYESTLFSVAFSLAFLGMLRVGELAQTGNKQSGHSLSIADMFTFAFINIQFGLGRKLCISALDIRLFVQYKQCTFTYRTVQNCMVNFSVILKVRH
jgi:hypothetical protein